MRLLMCQILAILSFVGPHSAFGLTELVDGDERVLVEPRTDMQFIELTGGCFFMETATSDVCVSAMAMGRFEVTNAAFAEFDENHQSGKINGISLGQAEWPVVNLSWQQADDFAQWLSSETGLSFRLPSEAEWEFAAHGGTETPWFWGDDLTLTYRYANLSDRDADDRLIDGFPATAPIASFDPNPYGLFDMLGNASEWVADAYTGSTDRYAGVTQDPLVTQGDGPLRVRRGGSFDQRAAQVSVAGRDFYLENLGVPQTGFRLVMELPE